MLIVLLLEERLHMFMLVLIVLFVSNVLVLTLRARWSEDTSATAMSSMMIIWLLALIVSMPTQHPAVSIFTGFMMMINIIILAPKSLREYTL
ncbi:hypothetical protein A2707_02100 [Candidatus Saccharibacteria bacterium RIFCSPHIGHO2_01_FULL_45_15]|nr:MAG: hypothetical protein A2707_02100 [Candidatus Saccharibacteria bacterium RIFCSPHIGHO2_01_FULL_45_15]OGL27589.1 MAG: hypothetical protein A3C39_00480 [Candidatus Saccharibacteria bacterium RIFCSPHIGHO2_02_FULL_46_12]OGL31627.1 MAG: hypothetical protein A3E76_00740 [Candidatus Saccharibacteria bacterium RIFCSPHIGHO2_12_FULL_44_22]